MSNQIQQEAMVRRLCRTLGLPLPSLTFTHKTRSYAHLDEWALELCDQSPLGVEAVVLHEMAHLLAEHWKPGSGGTGHKDLFRKALLVCIQAADWPLWAYPWRKEYAHVRAWAFNNGYTEAPTTHHQVA